VAIQEVIDPVLTNTCSWVTSAFTKYAVSAHGRTLWCIWEAALCSFNQILNQDSLLFGCELDTLCWRPRLIIPPSIHDLRMPQQQLFFLARNVGVRGVSALSLAIYSSYASFVCFWHSWNSCCLSAQHLVGVLIWRRGILFPWLCKHHHLYIPQTSSQYTKYLKEWLCQLPEVHLAACLLEQGNKTQCVIWYLTPCLSTGNPKLVSISPFVNKMVYSRLFTASSLRQKAQGQLSGWPLYTCLNVCENCWNSLGSVEINVYPSIWLLWKRFCEIYT